MIWLSGLNSEAHHISAPLNGAQHGSPAFCITHIARPASGLALVTLPTLQVLAFMSSIWNIQRGKGPEMDAKGCHRFRQDERTGSDIQTHVIQHCRPSPTGGHISHRVEQAICVQIHTSLHRSSLHRALHWGRLRAAAALLEAGASLALTDHRVRASFTSFLNSGVRHECKSYFKEILASLYIS